MDAFDRIAENRIQSAVDEGLFDDLPGTGKRLELEDLSRVPADLRGSYLMLKAANVLPEELELRKELVTLDNLLAAVRDEGEQRDLRAKRDALEIRYAMLMERRLGRVLPAAYRAKVGERLRGE